MTDEIKQKVDAAKTLIWKKAEEDWKYRNATVLKSLDLLDAVVLVLTEMHPDVRIEVEVTDTREHIHVYHTVKNRPGHFVIGVISGVVFYDHEN